MLREPFNGHKPSHYIVNPFIKSYIASETFVWSAYNFVVPIFSVFIATKIAGGSVQTASFAFSLYLISRVIFELVGPAFFSKTNDRQKLWIAIMGNVLLSLAYVGFYFSKSILPIYFFYILAGAGLGIAMPIKNSLFSCHLDRNKEPTEWGIHDAAIFIGMALAATVGGMIATQYGFEALFLLAATVNLLSAIPYLLYLK